MLSRRQLLVSGSAAAVARPGLAQSYRPVAGDWQSLASHYRVPDWFRDAKLGIWAHWGPQCQPAFGDWYARLLYVQGRLGWQQGATAYEHHCAHYGHPSRTGFIDIIGTWRAEEWQPEYLIRRYARLGARYFMAMGCHHDNLDLFASKHHEWNSIRVGPMRDIVGTWEPIARKAGLKFGISNHSGHAWHWYQTAYGYDAEGPMRGRRYDAYWLRRRHGRGKFWEGLDPQELYAGPYYVPPPGITSAADMNRWHEQRDGQWLETIPSANLRFVEKWLQRQNQLVEDYRPDIIYLDHARVPFGHYGLEAIAHYYNRAIEWHGSPDVVITAGEASAFEQRAIVSNVERGVLDQIQSQPWQTATCIGQWHYSLPVYQQNAYKTPKQIIQMLVDVVSKNGNLLLSIPVRGDGSIDDKEESILDELTAWTSLNGEAIFNSRPWHVFGEGPTAPPPSGAFGEARAKPPTSADLRFTRNGEGLYVFLMEWPRDECLIAALGTRAMPGAVIESVELLGGPTLPTRREPDGLHVGLPPSHRETLVPVLRIRGRGLV